MSFASIARDAQHGPSARSIKEEAKSPRRDHLRRQYRGADFPGDLARGKFTARIAQGCNVIRLDPEIAATFSTREAVNEAVGGVLHAARAARIPATAPGRLARAARHRADELYLAPVPCPDAQHALVPPLALVEVTRLVTARCWRSSTLNGNRCAEP